MPFTRVDPSTDVLDAIFETVSTTAYVTVKFAWGIVAYTPAEAILFIFLYI